MADLIKALTWVLWEAVDLSVARLADLDPEEAASELGDLMAIHALIFEMGGRGERMDYIRSELCREAKLLLPHLS